MKISIQPFNHYVIENFNHFAFITLGPFSGAPFLSLACRLVIKIFHQKNEDKEKSWKVSFTFYVYVHVYNLKCSLNREHCFSMCFMRQKSQFYRKSGNLKVVGHKNLSTHVSACIIFFKFCVKGTYFALFTNPS